MDYSTISNKTTFTETEELTNGELSERYYSLKKQYDNLANNFETTKQELHDTRRSYQTALDVQGHLTAELESYQEDEKKHRNDLNSRITSLQEDISAMREERSETAEKHASEIKNLEAEIRRLKEEQTLKVERESPERDFAELDEAKAAMAAAVSDATVVKAALVEARAEIASWRLKVEEMVNELAEMRVAADLKREELKAANEREAVALADLVEVKLMLHQCTESQDLQPHAVKGNSIFAEVEDKRQEMAKTLLQMKQTNSRLRRELANKQSELEALLHEKQTVWEQQAGASAHYDKELMDSYEERITQLEALCERQRRELAKWFGKLCDPTTQGWLPGVLDHLKSECERLRSEIISHGATQLASAAQVRELRRKLALATAKGAQTINSPANTSDSNNTIERTNVLQERSIGMPKVSVQVKARPSPDDVKKKVSFN